MAIFVRFSTEIAVYLGNDARMTRFLGIPRGWKHVAEQFQRIKINVTSLNTLFSITQ